MFKATLIAISLAGATVLAVAIGSDGATAGNNTRLIDQPAGAAIASQGLVDCASQTWPSIDAYCLRPVSVEGSVRMARRVQM